MKILSKKQHTYGNKILRLLIFFYVFISWISTATHADINILIDTNNSVALNGTISGNTIPVKKGEGSLILTAANSYTSGYTIVEAGALIVAHAEAVPTGDVTLMNNATFINIGSIEEDDEEEMQGGGPTARQLTINVKQAGDSWESTMAGLIDAAHLIGGEVKSGGGSDLGEMLSRSFQQAQAEIIKDAVVGSNQPSSTARKRAAEIRSVTVQGNPDIPDSKPGTLYVVSPNAVGNATIQAQHGTVLRLGSGKYTNHINEL